MRFTKSLIVLALSSSLIACGGSDSSDPVSGGDNGNTGGTGSTESTVYTEGVITGFGSVYVNGERYRSENADIALGNNPAADESQLHVGMVVSLAASNSNDGEDPVATNIRYEEHILGPVDSIDVDAGILMVFGQEVLFDDLTELELGDLGDISELTAATVIEVSGYTNEDGDFYATRIEVEQDVDEYKLKGDVAGLDTEAQTFMLGGLTIDYSAAEFDDLAPEDLADGLQVKVEGAVANYDAETMTFVAESIENKDNDIEELDDDIDEVKIAGIVRDFDDADGTFTVNNYRFSIDDDTEFEDGSGDRLVVGARVKVEAEYNDDDVLVADEVEFIAEKAVAKTEGPVTDIDADAESFVVNGTTFFATDDTRYLDVSQKGNRQFSFEDIAPNDYVKVLSSINDEGEKEALKIMRKNQEDREGELKGVPESVTAEGMTLAGVTVTFTEQTEFEGEDEELTLEVFIQLVTDNPEQIVEVEGDYDGDVLVAEEVSIKD